MPVDHRPAIAHLRKAGSTMGRIIDAVGECELRPGSRGDHFTTLLRAIVGQQLSAKAAESIWQRVLALHADGMRVRPDDVLSLHDASLRACGLSASKVAFMKDLAGHVEAGRVNFRRLVRRPDDEIITELVRVKGIGRWTAEMFLLFKLGRSDVWPVDDLGIQNAVKRHLGVEPTKANLNTLAEPWRPYRSVASWYLWRSLSVPAL